MFKIFEQYTGIIENKLQAFTKSFWEHNRHVII